MKALVTRALIARGWSKNNVYEWSTRDASTIGIKRACMGVKAFLNNWHDRLGHPSSKILHQIVSQNNLSISSILSQSSHDSCYYNKSHKLPFDESNL